MTTPARRYAGHDPSHGPTGTDFLLHIWDEDHAELTLRPGLDETERAWSPPIPLADASVLRLVRGDVDGGRR